MSALDDLKHRTNLDSIEYAIIHYAIFGGEIHSSMALSAANELAALLAERDTLKARVAELEASRAELMAELAAYGDTEPPNVSGHESHAIDQILSIGSIKAEHPHLYAKAVAELAALQALSAESKNGHPASLTPRQCRACQAAAEKMREAAAECADNCDLPHEAGGGAIWMAQVARRQETSDAIRALPLPDCGACNPLAPDADDVTCQCECGCINPSRMYKNGRRICYLCAATNGELTDKEIVMLEL